MIEYRDYGGMYLPVGSKGYADAGASHTKRALKGFNARSGRAWEDIDLSNKTLRQRARMLYMAAPVATSAIRTSRTNAIGCGLKLKARIDRQRLGLDTESADEWERRVEGEFSLWAMNKRACDATGINDFYAMQQLAYLSWLLSGDAFVLLKRYPQTQMQPYSLRLMILEADRIATPPTTGVGFSTPIGKAANGNRIFDGVEVDKNGMIVAYHIAESENLMTRYQRVEAYGERTGLPNILQIMDSERPEQYRGVSYLAHIIEPVLQMRRYTESELMAALVESFFTAFVKTEAAQGDPAFNEALPDDGVSASDQEYEMGPGVINYMQPNESIEFGKPARPSSGFGTFMRAMCEQVGAALEIPADLLLKSFNASYSASRAALLEAWKAFRMRREWFTNDFCHPVYEAWLAEAVAIGRVDAPGFFTDPAIRDAWLGSEWIGPAQGQLDPVKEITAEILAVSEGFSTREQSTMRLNGGQWDSNVERLKLENERLHGVAQNAEHEMPSEEAAHLVREMRSAAIRRAVEGAFEEGENHEKTDV